MATKTKEKQAIEAIHPPGDHTCVCSECGNEITVGIGVKCNTQICPKCEGPMTAKTAGVNRESELSMDSKRTAVGKALRDRFNPGNTEMFGPYIEEQYETEVIYSLGDDNFKINYSITATGDVTLIGDPVKVERKVVYNPIEALQKAYSDVIAEAGKRNANKDSAKIRQIITLCNDLLSSENPSRESTDRAIDECRGALAWLRAVESVKTEDKGKFPSAAYAYAPDLDNPPSWKLRLWESVDGPATVAQLGRAASALSPGGFDGKPVKIPARDLPTVKRTIREG